MSKETKTVGRPKKNYPNDVKDLTDEQIISLESLFKAGQTNGQVAESLGVKPAQLQQRYNRICEKLEKAKIKLVKPKARNSTTPEELAKIAREVRKANKGK